MNRITPLHRETFKSGSRTYYNSSVFFPESVKNDVYVLYGFVRVSDDYVDQIPQDAAGFHSFVDTYRWALGLGRGARRIVDDPIIDPFVELQDRAGFEQAWADAFLHSMELDLTKRVYKTIDETLEYIYGSAEVIGLFMARLLGLARESHNAAMLQGRSMQYINFIRDLDEDRRLGRTYLPLANSGLQSLSPEHIRKTPDVYSRFIRDQIDLYLRWQREAEEGYHFIPRRHRIPIKTASDMYKWTARRIAKDPLVVFQRKVKPPRAKVLLTALWNFLTA